MGEKPTLRIMLLVVLSGMVLLFLAVEGGAWAEPGWPSLDGTIPRLTPTPTPRPSTPLPSPTPAFTPTPPSPSPTPIPSGPLPSPAVPTVVASVSPEASPTATTSAGTPTAEPTSFATPMAPGSPSPMPSVMGGTPATSPSPAASLLVPNRSLIWTSSGGEVQVSLPAGATGEEVQLSLRMLSLTEVQSGREGLRPSGSAFRLGGVKVGGRPLWELEWPFSLKVITTSEEIRCGGGHPENLYLGFWDETVASWQLLETNREPWGEGVLLSGEDARLGTFVVLAVVPTELPPTGAE